MSDHVIHVGPNATLSRAGLRINNAHAELRHIGDFRAFAQATSARIESVLATLFPEPTSLTGKVDAPKVQAWAEYAGAVMQLQVDEPAGALKAGKTVLRWCLAAYCVAHIQKHAVRDTDDFMPVWYMLQSGRALATTQAQWRAYEIQQANWLSDFAAGRDRTDPRPAAVAVAIPWPAKLGVDLGGPDQLFTAACAIASDIIASPHGNRLAVARHIVEFERPDALIALFDEKAPKEGGPAMLALRYGGEQIRAQRMATNDGQDHYVFRRIAQHNVPPSELTGLVTAPPPVRMAETKTEANHTHACAFDHKVEGHMSDLTIIISPNTTLSRSGLRVNGEPAKLRHFEDFRRFVLATSARIGTVLAILFPEPTSLLVTPESAKVEAWREYSGAVLQLQHVDPVIAQGAGQTILRWVLAAYCVALVQNHYMLADDDYLPVPYLLGCGGALSCTVAHWLAYLSYRAGLTSELAAGMDTRDPRPAPVTVAIPWPGDRGIDLGGPEMLFKAVSRVTSDINAGGGKAHLDVLGHRVEFDSSDRLLSACRHAMFPREAAQQKEPETLSIRLAHAGTAADGTTRDSVQMGSGSQVQNSGTDSPIGDDSPGIDGKRQ